MAPSARGKGRLWRVQSLLSGWALVLVCGTAVAQATPAPWSVRQSPAADQLYATLGSLGIAGPGPFSWYSAPGTARGSLGRRVAADSALEVLHMLPSFLPDASPAGLVAVLRRAAGMSSRERLDARGARIAAGLRTAAPSAPEAALLRELSDAVAASAGSTPVGAGFLRALDVQWNAEFLPALLPYLDAEGMSGGTIIVSPALGDEGRFLDARSAGAAGAVIAVTARETPTATLLGVAREVCFPVVRRAAMTAIASRPRSEYARRTSVAAVRCGDLLVQTALPAHSPAYRRIWMRAASAPSNAVFGDVFPPDPAFESLVASTIGRAFAGRTPASTGRSSRGAGFN